MDVPPDIKAAVDAIFDKVEAGESIADAMCRALRAERERAAKIAEEYKPKGFWDSRGWGSARSGIAAKIRRG